VARAYTQPIPEEHGAVGGSGTQLYDGRGMPDHRVVFVGGLHRSGTTLLERCLTEHPLLSGLSNTPSPADEGQHLQKVYRSAKRYGGPGRFAFSPEAHLTEDSPLVSEEARERIFASWSRYWDLECPYLLEKSPPNLIRMRFLQALFPGSLFVVLTRHPIAVSYATQGFRTRASWFRRRMRFEDLMRHWVVAHRLFEHDEPHIENLIVVRFERLLHDPDGCLRDVYEFLGVETWPRDREVRPHGNERHFKRWREEIGSPRLAAPLELLRLEYEPQVRDLGYSLEDLDLVAEGYARTALKSRA
jgi:Sulfotransferase family